MRFAARSFARWPPLHYTDGVGRRARWLVSGVLAAGIALAAVLAGHGPPAAAQSTTEVFPYESAVRYRVDGQPYRLYRWSIPLGRVSIDVVDMGMGTNLARVLRDRHASLVINGGFYGRDMLPEGLVVTRGHEVSPFVERLGGGVVTLAGAVAAHHDAAGFSPIAGTEFAIQCKPRLVVDGAVNIARYQNRTAARTALCLRDGGRALDVYVARVDPSRGRAGPALHTFARQLVDEGCTEALNLDGGPSTGVAWRSSRGTRALNPRRGIRHALVFTVTN